MLNTTELLTDVQLFELIRQDDRHAFETLYHRYWPYLVKIAYKRLLSREKAEDLVQEIFISFYQKRYTLTITVSLRAYFSQAIKYKILNEFRAEDIRAAYLKQILLKDFSENDLSNHLDAKQLHRKIDTALASLPEKCKQAFILSRDESLPNKDISRQMNISVSTVEKHIGKALKILRESVKEYEAE